MEQDPFEVRSYVLLPSRGVSAKRSIELNFLTRFGTVRSTLPPTILNLGTFLAPLHEQGAPRQYGDAFGPVRVVDSVHEDGPKLVEMNDAAVEALKNADSGLRLFPLRHYGLAQSPDRPPRSPPPGAAGASPLSLQILCATTAQAIEGVDVIAFTNASSDEGAIGKTDSTGGVSLSLGSNAVTLDSLYVAAPSSGHWGFYRTNFHVQTGDQIRLQQISAPYDDCVRRGQTPFSMSDGSGVRVAVIDSGIGPHGDLSVVDGRNTVQAEPRGAYLDNGLGHGTHVAGLIGGRSSAGGPPGLAPSAELWSGRIFGAGSTQATNYSIMKAMILATDDNCDLINLSLASDNFDTVLQDAVTDATHQGAVVFAAVGNQGRQGVAYPARYNDAVGVSAFGIDGTYPANTPHSAEIGTPQRGTEFFASFSNWGDEVRFTGPGVGVISSALGGGYAIRSGTSMACAVVTGMAARLLSRDLVLLGATRNQARSAAIQNMLIAHAASLGFGFRREGSGRL